MLAGCWSHTRRKSYELHASDSSRIATETVERMARLWQVEETARFQSPDAWVAARQATSAAVVMDSSPSGRRPCRGSPASRSWPRRFAMPPRVVPSSSSSSPRAASSSTPTSLSALSVPRQLREQTVSSMAATAAEGPGRQWPRSFRRRR